jgi:phage terminase large subunit-like protein
MGELAATLSTASWSFALPDWVERLKEGRSLVPDLPLDLAEADRAVGIFNNLRLPDVPGQPRLGEAAGDWIRDVVRAIFGSLDAETGRRWVPEAFILVPKKNSKTTSGAGIALTALLLNVRPNAELQLIGPTQEIADVAFGQVKGMIEADEYLVKRFQVRDHIKTIEDRLTKAKLKIKTFDMKVATGSKPVFVLLDEVHLLSKIAGASRIVGQLRGNMLANPESLFVMITTQSDEMPDGVFKAELEYARGVRDGRITNRVRMLPILYEFSEEMQKDPARPWADPANWSMVLPNLGRSITIERLQDDFAAAKEKGEAEIRRWASQHLNIQIGLALHAGGWIGASYWEGAADPTLTLDELLERSEVAVLGIDGGGLDDLLGAAVIGRCRETRDWLHWGHAWAHTDVFERRKDIAERLHDFARAGQLTICARPTQDLEEIAALAVKLKARRLLPKVNGVGLDPQSVAALVDALAAAGIGGEQVTGIAQGYRLSGAVWGLERKLKDGTFWHCGQDLMAWVVGNAKVEQRGNAVLITKEAAGKAKIDPLMASFDAVELMGRNPIAEGASIYDTRGLRTL